MVRKGASGSEEGPWAKFIAPFLPGKQKSTDYVLFPGTEVEQMITNQLRGETVVLRVGSQGPLVDELQRKLSIKPDGGFGTTTFNAVIRFQTDKFGSKEDTGIVDPRTAAALGFELPFFDFDDAIAGGSGQSKTSPMKLKVRVPSDVRKEDVQPVEDLKLEFDPGTFVQTAYFFQKRFNQDQQLAPFFVSAGYAVARAVIETGLQEAGRKTPGSDAQGPLQVSSAEWQTFLQNAGELAADFVAADRDHPIRQMAGALYRMHTDMKAVSKLKTPKPEPADGPFQPSNLDLFHAYLFDSPAAAAAIIDVQDDPDKINQSLKDVLQGIFTDDQMRAMFAVRSQYMGAFDAPKTVAGFIAETEKTLNAASQKTSALIETHAPEEYPTMKETAAPWLDEAERALAAGVNEHEVKHVPTILQYFASTSMGVPDRMHAWSGAFAAHCIEASGNKHLIPKDAQAAVNWRQFGFGIPPSPGHVPRGAVVVFSRGSGTGGSGHVAFFSEFTNNGASVRVLGGKQSDAVNMKTFPASRIVAIRWVETAPTPTEDLEKDGVEDLVQEGGKPLDMEISQAAFDLIVAFEVTGKAAYERQYRGPIWPGVKSGITIGIGYDVGHQKEAQVRKDCAGILDADMINALVTACGTKGPAAKALLPGLKGRVDVPWEKALQLFKVQSIPRWTAVVRKHLDNTDKLSPDSLGALVSLTFNRGPSFSEPGGRYAEMRAIKQHMASGNFARIPAELRNMKRIWPTVAGLQRRRDAEARLFEQGLR